MSAEIGNSVARGILRDTHEAVLGGSGGTDTHRAELDGTNSQTARLAGVDGGNAILTGSNARTAVLSGNPASVVLEARLHGGLTQDTHYAQLVGESSGSAVVPAAAPPVLGNRSFTFLNQMMRESVTLTNNLWVEIGTFDVTTPPPAFGTLETNGHVVRFAVQIAVPTNPLTLEYEIRRNNPPATISTGSFLVPVNTMYPGLFVGVDESPRPPGQTATYALRIRNVTADVPSPLGWIGRQHRDAVSYSNVADTHAAILQGDEGVDTHEAILEGKSVAGIQLRLIGDPPDDTHMAVLTGAPGTDPLLSTGTGSVHVPATSSSVNQIIHVSDTAREVSVTIPNSADDIPLRMVSGIIAISYRNRESTRNVPGIQVRLNGTRFVYEIFDSPVPANSNTVMRVYRFDDNVFPPAGTDATYTLRLGRPNDSETCLGAAFVMTAFRVGDATQDTHAAMLMGSGIVDTHVAGVYNQGTAPDTHMAALEGDDTIMASFERADTHMAVLDGADTHEAVLEGDERTDTHAASLDGSARAYGSASTVLGGVDQ